MRKIPHKITPIKHEILTEIFAKGLLSYDELRIALFIIRWSWGYHENWSKEIMVSQIAEATNIDKSNCNKILKRMVEENKLLRDGNKWQFNEHTQNWKMVKNTTMVKNTIKSGKKYHKKWYNLPSEQANNTDENLSADNLKKYKEIKENNNMCIINNTHMENLTSLKEIDDNTMIEFWQRYRQALGIPKLGVSFKVKYVNDVMLLLQDHTIDEIIKAIDNGIEKLKREGKDPKAYLTPSGLAKIIDNLLIEKKEDKGWVDARGKEAK